MSGVRPPADFGSVCGRLIAAILATGGLLSIPAYALRGNLGSEGVGWSTGLCGAPGILAVLAIYKTAPAHRIWTLLAAMLLRMFTVLTGVLVLWQLRPDLGLLEFQVWLIAEYLILLFIETWLLVPMVQLQPPVSKSAKDHSA